MAGRFRRQGKGTLRFATAVAVPGSPTRAEITASVAVIADFREEGGLTSEQQFIETPDYVAAFTPQIPGRQTAGNPSLTFYDLDNATNATRTALAEGTQGFLLRMPYGDVPTRRMEVWPCTIGALNDTSWATGDEAAAYTVALAVTSAPSKNVTIPA